MEFSCALRGKCAAGRITGRHLTAVVDRAGEKLFRRSHVRQSAYRPAPQRRRRVSSDAFVDSAQPPGFPVQEFGSNAVRGIRDLRSVEFRESG